MKNNMLIYVSKDRNIKLEVNIKNEGIWTSQDEMANLYDKTKNNICMHLKNIFDEGELRKYQVVKKFLPTANDNKKYSVLHYNLDGIIDILNIQYIIVNIKEVELWQIMKIKNQKMQ